MNRIIIGQARARAALAAAVSSRVKGPRDRGDVPGWVLITIMTAGLVTALWALAGPQLGQLFSDAISSVKGP
ncbi:hypothetical protein GCM10009817_33230 [Terrabacter lapilli]|uniref:Flagellin-like protein n=1 Tax=Terrabacter lapilli TaxID=436231 RepID=A0ABN2SM48_9MICO|nr:hypothetical protein [Terrabacter sp.]